MTTGGTDTTAMSTDSVARLDSDAIYLGDAGHVFCRRHAGYWARNTGRDLSGQPVLQVTVAELTEFGLDCERCGSKGGAA